jgi:hypothetical protein
MLHKEWTEVGATELIEPEQGACLLADMRHADKLAAAIRAALGGDRADLAGVGEAAQRLAVGWGEAAYSKEFRKLLQPHVVLLEHALAWGMSDKTCD